MISYQLNFGEDQTKWFIISKAKCLSKLNVSYGDHDIKQDHTGEYLGCHFDSNVSGESTTLEIF